MKLVVIVGLLCFIAGCQVIAADEPQPPHPPLGCQPDETSSPRPGVYYYTSGNLLMNQDHEPHMFRGVDRPSLDWVPVGIGATPEDWKLMASWGAKIVRLSLHQDFWVEGSDRHDANYTCVVDNNIKWAHDNGIDVIIDLQYTDGGDLHNPDPTTLLNMPDKNSITFWKEVATKYGSYGSVIFELFNEPHDVDWNTWRNGNIEAGGQWVGLQTLYDTIRATGSNNLIIAGGLSWSYDLSQADAYALDGYNIVYNTHVYYYPGHTTRDDWDKAFGYLSDKYPLIATEFGNFDCSGEFSASFIEYCEEKDISWLAWAWYPGGCKFPALISDWSGTPVPGAGTVVRDALLKAAEDSQSNGGVLAEEQ